MESHGHDFGSETVLSFRLLGPDGQRPRDVQLRGRSISGTVRDGDWIEVSARERSGRLEVEALRNLTTRAEVTTSGSSTSVGARVAKGLFLVVFVAVLLFIAWIMLGVFGVVESGWPFGDGGLSGEESALPFDPGDFDDPDR